MCLRRLHHSGYSRGALSQLLSEFVGQQNPHPPAGHVLLIPTDRYRNRTFHRLVNCILMHQELGGLVQTWHVVRLCMLFTRSCPFVRALYVTSHLVLKEMDDT